MSEAPNGFHLGDLVITPLGNLATIEGMSGGRALLCYKGAINKSGLSAWVSLPPALIRRVEKDKPFPNPVRIKVPA